MDSQLPLWKRALCDLYDRIQNFDDGIQNLLGFSL